ncbi:hypothetical protein M413DRAFT_179231 [Hebeloma cylindrosporum]|uniref:DUF4203 domain-containing protein n=1 Tax=Hebeloma cylindrosporum TaxID=76867 RepID=A0A0C2XRS5_HEBCY|nr:hypothetical protein M413DRAFT_179231 [Hebeloma cylindrosporum h7]
MLPPCRRPTLILEPPTPALKTLSLQQSTSHTHLFRRCRRNSSFTPSLWIIFLVIFLSFVPTLHAFPVQPPLSPSLLLDAFPSLLPELHTLHRRRGPLIIVNTTGQATVINSDTRTSVPQGAATDAGGVGLDAPALIWISFCFVVGLPMAFAGIRGWRLTTGVGVGLAGTVASWAAFINSISAAPLSDLILTLIILGFFALLFAFGAIPYGRVTGIACIGLVGGTAFGVRVVILKAGLLISGSQGYTLDWVLVGFFGVAGGVSIIWERSQRGGLVRTANILFKLLSLKSASSIFSFQVFGCASIGTFLSFLGVDLLIHQQAGMSRGLRFLFDRNSSHFLDIVGGGYTPATLTQVLIGVSLFLT